MGLEADMVKTAFNSYGAKLGAHNIKTGGVPIDMYAARSAGNRYGGVKSNIVAGCVPTGGVTHLRTVKRFCVRHTGFCEENWHKG